MDRDDLDNSMAMKCIDDSPESITTILHNTFQRHRLVGKRSFSNQGATKSGCRNAAPPFLRKLRLHASGARREVSRAMCNGETDTAIKAVKRKWNLLSARCRSASKAVKAQQCADWHALTIAQVSPQTDVVHVPAIHQPTSSAATVHARPTVESLGLGR